MEEEIANYKEEGGNDINSGAGTAKNIDSTSESNRLPIDPEKYVTTENAINPSGVPQDANSHSYSNSDPTTPRVSTQQPKSEEARPKSSGSGEVVFGGKKKKRGPVPPGAHQVTFTVTIAKAIPTAECEESHPADGNAKRRRRIVEAPRAQSYYHCEYSLLPDDDDPVRTDVVTFGVAAKIYTERQEPKVLKTWQDGPLTWVAWTHCHTIHMTEDVLLKLFKHTLELRIWDTKDKVSTRARFDRPKAFKLPTAKPGEEADAVGGVKAMVMKQARSFMMMQPKRSYINRPLPMQAKVTAMAEKEQKEQKEELIMKAKKGSTHTGRVTPQRTTPSKGSGTATRRTPERSSRTPDRKTPTRKTPEQIDKKARRMSHQAELPKPAKDQHERIASGLIRKPAAAEEEETSGLISQDGMPLRSYSRLGRLAGVDTRTEVRQDKKQQSEFGEGKPGTSNRSQSQPPPSSRRMSTLPGNSTKDDFTLPKDVESSASVRRGASQREARARVKKAEAAALQAAEEIRKYGIACLSIRMATLFAGVHTVTKRLDKRVPGLEDIFLTVTVSDPLMTESMCQKLNPLILKVTSASNMPAKPINFNDLKTRCHPAYIKYKFYKEPEYVSVAREQDSAIYWDDINVVLAGTIAPSELREYLNGPPFEMEVHDRDRLGGKQKLTASLFGDDLEDEKISNVGIVSSKRTNHNPFHGRDKPWDPHGVARFDLSELLMGNRVLHLSAPIQPCPVPDVLGTREGRQDGKLVGIAGAVDGPVDTPLSPGHYMQSHSVLKVKVEIAYPLVTPEELASKEAIPITEECPFGRIVFRFAYKNVKFLVQLQSLITEINSKALNIDHLPQHVIDAALSTYKLSVEQQNSKELNIVTGFQVLDGQQHLFILEGLHNGAVQELWHTLPKPENTDVEVLYNSDLCFAERRYAPLDVDLCRIKLHEPLSLIVQQPLLYIRDMVPKPCFQALTKLQQMTQMLKLRDAVRNDLFPSAEMVVSMSREFGVPLTAADFEELQPEPEGTSPGGKDKQALSEEPSRTWLPLDNYNPQYVDHLFNREEQPPQHDYVHENKEAVAHQSNLNYMERSRTMPVTVHASMKVAHNYSSQSLNSTEQAKEKLRQILAGEPDQLFTYCPNYHSMTVVPVNPEALKKAEKQASKDSWKTTSGFVYPGKKTMIQANVHPKKPHPSRVESLVEPWKENNLHTNKLEPTLQRDRYTWAKRREDIDLWTPPHPVFGRNEPITIHLAGQKLKEERQAVVKSAKELWQAKVIVENPRMGFHRCATETEFRERGFKSSSQLDRQQSLLKDPPNKFSLKMAGFAIEQTPPLSVVLNPSVDTARRLAGLPLLPAVAKDGRDKIRGFAPGPYHDRGWHLEKNKIPVHDYEHRRLAKLNGQDFSAFHQEHSNLHKRHIEPLTDKEYNTHLFRYMPGYDRYLVDPSVPRPRLLPDLEDLKSFHVSQATAGPTYLGNKSDDMKKTIEIN